MSDKEIAEYDIEINLGDIIQIESTNTDYNSYFIVEYIDNEIIDIVNLRNNNKQTLNIKDGYLTETTIQKIILLNRSDKQGYARQNNFLLDTYIKIFFTDGTNITGQITNLEENQDMIEITTTQDEKMYIDFEYKGIPKNIPIQKITITETPGIFDKLKEDENKNENKNEEKNEDEEKDEDEVVYKPQQISTTFVQKKVDFFADLGPEIPNQYDIEMQLSNLLDELLSTTYNKIDKTNIYIIVNRFKELREKFSTFDKNNIITGKKNITGQYKPLVHSLDRLDTNLRWIIPTVQNKPKLYSEKINDNQTAFVKSNLDDDLNTYKNAKNDYVNNKDYLSFYKGIQEIFKPFDTTISDLKTVNTNLETIVDNLNEEQYNRYVLKINKENDEIIKKKFYLQRYITESIGKNDAISIKSIIMLPKPAIEFSRVSLPGTDILTRTNLSHNWFYNFKFFTKNRYFKNIDLNSPYDYEENETNFLETPLSFTIPENTTYKSALDSIIPMTASIIRMLEKDYIGYNFNDMLSFYEPFMFYSDTIVFAGLSKSHKRGPYKEFIYHIKNNIKKHYEMFRKQNNKYKIYKKKYDKSNEEEYEEKEEDKSIFQRINEDDKKAIIKEYNLKTKNKNVSSSEFLNKIVELDYGKFYMINQLKLNQNLYTPELEKILKQSEFGEDVFSKSNSCFKHTIAKKYTSLKALKDDSGKEEVFFDKEYDTTPYEILKKYKEQRKEMNDDNRFLDFLTLTLKAEYNFSENIKEIAESILLGKKKVETNNYAVLIIYPKLISTDILSEEEKKSVEIEADVKKQVFYYRREKKQWIKDDDMDNAEFANEIFCNIDKDCFYNRNNEICETIENSAARMKKIAKKSLEFKINLTMEEFIKNLKDIYSTKEKQIHKIYLIQKAKNEYFSLRAHSIGTNVKVVEKVVSPYETIKENILQINDFVEKQRLIIEFKSEYCRQATKDEDKYWFYCKQTDTKLLPTFYYELANAFFKGKYEEHIKKIISKQGKIEDGKIYDKYSNEFICDQDTVTQDEYDENGFKKKTRGALDDDENNENDDENETGDYNDVNEGEGEEEGGEGEEEGEEEEKEEDSNIVIDNKKIMLTKTNQLIYSVSSAILNNLDIMSSGKEILSTILAHASRIIEKIMLSETEHLKYERKKEKTGKKMESYDNYQNKLIFFYTVAVIFVVIQTQIPSLQRKKTSSGCVYNLSGYPLTQDDNYSGIKYLSCIIEKMKSGLSEPWKTVKKYKKDELQTKITAVINDIILEPEIKIMLEIKRSHPEPIYIPNEYELAKWVLFQPPLIKTSVEKKISDVSTPLKEEFIETLKTGNKKQHLYMGNIYKKIIENTYAIVDNVNKIVSDENALLKAGPVIFLENACCQQRHIEKGILYFSEKNPNIQKNIEFVDTYEKVYNDIKSLSIPSYICSTRSKLVIVLSNLEKYSSNNIYAAFIHYCNLKTDLPVPNDLISICPEKINSLHPLNFEDYVQLLKDNGKTQTNHSLENLMSIVALRNHVQIENEVTAYDIKKSDQIIDLIKDPTEENRKTLKRKLYIINNSMQKEIIDYLYLNGELGVSESKTVKDSNGKYRYELFDFLETITSDWTDIKKLHNFIKNAILNVVDVIPSLLTNKKKINYDSKTVVGKHWKFAKTHMENIKNFINKYFESINTYNDDNVCNLLQNITFDDDSNDDIKLYDLKTVINNMTVITESFDKDECKQIYKYFYLTLFHTIMVESQEFKYSLFATDESDLQDKENEFYKKVSDLVVIILKMDMDNKKVENFTYSHLFEQNYKKKTKEKNILTAELGKIDKSDFDIEKQLKKHKLERWNTNKDVFKYNKENYEYNE